MNRVEWEIVLEKRGRGRGLSYFYRPWVYRKFILRSNQTLDYYDLIHLHWRGSLSVRGATVEPIADSATELVNEKKPFLFVIITEESEKIYLNAESDAIRQQAIYVLQEAAKRRFPSLPVVATGGTSRNNQESLSDVQKEAVISTTHQSIPYRPVSSLPSSCIILENGETYVPSIRTSLIVHQSEMERAYYEVGVPGVVKSTVPYPPANELIPIISVFPAMQTEKPEERGKEDTEIVGIEEMDREDEELSKFKKEEAEEEGEAEKEWRKECKDLIAQEEQEEAGGEGVENDESLSNLDSNAVVATSSLTDIPADTIDVSAINQTRSSTLTFPKYGIPLSHVETVIEQCGGRAALEGLSTAEVCFKFIRPWTASMQCSYCDYLKEKSPDLVQTATVFISHAWKYKFLDVMDAVKEHFEMFIEESAGEEEIVKPADAELQDTNTIEKVEEEENKPERKQQNQLDKVIIWFDLFSNNQHKAVNLDFNWWCTTFKSAIEKFNHTLLVLSPWHDPIPLTRAWCLFEIYCTAQNKNVRFEIAMSKAEKTSFTDCMLTLEFMERMNTLFATINLERSEATNPLDRDRIFEVVKATIGFNEVNFLVLEKMRNWILQTAEKRCKKSSSIIEQQVFQTLIGLIHGYQGKYKEGEIILEECFHLQQQYLGEAHIITLSTQFIYAGVLHENGKYLYAEQLAKSCLVLHEQLNTDEKLQLSKVKISFLLGLISLKIGQFKKALEILEDCSHQQKQQFGESNLDTFMFHSNLAIAYCKVGDYNQAEQLCFELLEHVKSNKINEAIVLIILGDIYIARGEFDKAERLIDIDYCRSVLGENHPQTLALIAVTAGIRRKQGRYDESEALQLSLLERYTTVFGENHPKTFDSFDSLGCFYMFHRRDLKQAEFYLNKAYEGNKQLFGEKGLQTLNTLVNIATLRSNQHRFQEAILNFHTCLQGLIPIHGENSPKLLPLLDKLASLVHKIGRKDLAERFYRLLYNRCCFNYTENHIDSIQALINLAIVCRHEGSPANILKAEEFFLKVLNKMKNQEIIGGLNEDHPLIICVYHQLGVLYMVQNDNTQSERYLLLAISGSRKVLGDKHPETMTALFALGALYSSNGRLMEAKLCYEECANTRCEILGEDDPYTIDTKHYLECAEKKLLAINDNQEGKPLN